jgi:PTH1 family peptidyl-tRNA hydrolase
MIRLIVGLGNPGKEYSLTRHNVGFWWVDLLAKKYNGLWKMEGKFFGEVCKIKINNEDVWLLKPLTYMNLSGKAVAGLARFYQIPVEDILVVHDELDILCGQAKIKQGGGHAGHNGLKDIGSILGKDFWRLRLGIDHPGDRALVSDYVLSSPSKAQLSEIEMQIYHSLSFVEAMQQLKMEEVMRQLNQK